MPPAADAGALALVLRPATPVLNRGPGVLQVGLDPPRACVPDDPSVRRLLDALARPAGHPADAPLTAPASTALARLHEAGLVLPAPRHPHAPGLRPLLAQFGPDAPRRHAARAAVRVHVRTAPGSVLATTLAALLAEARLAVTDDPGHPGAVHLVVHPGPLPRETLDPLVRGSVPHLLVAGDATGLRVGPFVEPGRTACLRCVDAHESVPDQRRALLLAQAAAQATAHPAPRDPLLDRLALAWAVRDLVRWADRDEPTTWSATVDLGPHGAPERTVWGRHPYCGCSWDAFLELP
ncbi:hypothetical protein GUY44_16255 [Pimelobacter simplex]|uniref:Molybdopterin biosynthesis protein MoeB n=1 Tax=Nocardioides simplex TaxID=2045 RepID=A0A0A1DHQ8_NOCSI|nr:hypothetical protein [Pimelobacter simplex]AIY16911.2 Molybdopterin biosynthesis protein MoeB [Pimelobacter simplex]MCG8152043.1 hypothetical protein [Pimelobacter simplex]GEB12795.1 thiamin biosynthesis protein [Pimelobacter simplex]SFM54159.1 hypothetical protein SAMN05421671_2235 [Pimelobacter simplex]